MGQQHGILLKQSLVALNNYLHVLMPSRDLEVLLRHAEGYEPKLPTDIRAELKAMSDASGVPYTDLVALNVTPKLRCSALAVWGDAKGDGGILMGRNADYFSMGLGDRGGVVIVYHPDKGKAFVSVTYLGMVGAFTGVNEDGVAFGNMLVFNAAEQRMRPDGLPIQLAFRLAAQECSSAEEMCRFLEEQEHMIPMNAMLADESTALVVELGSDGTHVRRGKRGFVAVSNYFLARDLRRSKPSCARYDVLVGAAEEHYGKFTVSEMKAALYDARMAWLNLQAVIFEPSKSRMHVSINRIPASKGPFHEFDLKRLFDDSGAPPAAPSD